MALVVEEAPPGPVAGPDELITTVNTPATVDVLANDEGEDLSVTP